MSVKGFRVVIGISIPVSRERGHMSPGTGLGDGAELL